MSDQTTESIAIATENCAAPLWLDVAIELRSHLRKLILLPLCAGVAATALTYTIKPTFTAKTTFLPPQSQQSGNLSAALASLGGLSSLAGAAGGAGLRSPADQYVALIQSVTVSNRIIDQFKLMEVYGEELRIKTREALADAVKISANRKDNLITVEVSDRSPQRAAEIANRYVEELRRLTGQLALTEAQQRRLFFEEQLRQSKLKLTEAQQALLASGYSENTLKAEPKAAAESFARLRAEMTSAEVRLQTLRSQLRDNTPEVQQQASTVAALRSNLGALQQTGSASNVPEYVTKYREFKYQEALFEIFSRQFEMARVDESKDGLPIQVVDVAQPPELKSKPRRAVIAISVTLGVFFMLLCSALGMSMKRRLLTNPAWKPWLAKWRAARESA